MDLTNPKGKTNLFGLTLPNIAVYGIAIGLIFIIYKFFHMIYDKIASLFGLNDNKDKIANDTELKKLIGSNAGVINELNSAARTKAEKIFTALDAYGYDIKTVYDVFMGITGPNQMGAVFQAFGTRKISLFGGLFSKEGNLIDIIKFRITKTELMKNLGTSTVKWSINTKLNWLGTIK